MVHCGGEGRRTSMAQPQQEPLRALSEQEERELKRLAKATSERLDVVHRAKALVAVASGKPFTEAAHEAGVESGDAGGKLGKGLKARGPAGRSTAAGAGRKPTQTGAQPARITPREHPEAGRTT